MKPYTREVAEKIIECRQDPEGKHENDDFIVKDDGVFPVKGVASIQQEFLNGVWRPACELSVQGESTWLQPSLPIPFNANELAAFFLHGNGWYVRESFGAWDDGPDDVVFDNMIQPDDDIASLVVPVVKKAVTEAFDAYRAAECVVGPYDTTYSEKIQELEKQCGPWLDAQDARERIKQAHREADEYEAAWRKKMVNQLLAVEEIPLGDGQKATSVANTQPEVTLLATRQQLIDAFNAFTGMDATWFENLKDTPALLSARKVRGQGGRGHISEPLFCPYEVLRWLIDPARRKGRPLRRDKGWELFERDFPRVFAAYSVGDPRTD